MQSRLSKYNFEIYTDVQTKLFNRSLFTRRRFSTTVFSNYTKSKNAIVLGNVEESEIEKYRPQQLIVKVFLISMKMII